MFCYLLRTTAKLMNSRLVFVKDDAAARLEASMHEEAIRVAQLNPAASSEAEDGGKKNPTREEIAPAEVILVIFGVVQRICWTSRQRSTNSSNFTILAIKVQHMQP
jgi:hypothetical protein